MFDSTLVGGGSDRVITFPPHRLMISARCFALLRLFVDATAQAAVRDAILVAYTEAEEAATNES